MTVGELREILDLAIIDKDADVCIDIEGSLWRLEKVKINISYDTLEEHETVVSLYSTSEVFELS